MRQLGKARWSFFTPASVTFVKPRLREERFFSPARGFSHASVTHCKREFRAGRTVDVLKEPPDPVRRINLFGNTGIAVGHSSILMRSRSLVSSK
jgi:hypothetical protein